MKGQSFEERFTVLRQRLAALLRSAEGWSMRQTMLIEEVLEEMACAGQELQARNDELASACQALEADYQLYRDLFEFAPAGYLVTDCDGVIQKANRAVASLLNTLPDLLLGKPLSGFVADEDQEALQERLAQLRAGRIERTTDWEMWMRPSGGLLFRASISVASARDSLGRPFALRWLMQDITWRKWTEEALRRSEERYRAIADSIQDGLTIIEDGQAVYANSRACEIFGYPEEEYLKMTSIDLAAPEERERLQRIIEEIRRTGIMPDELEFWALRRDGTRRYVRNRYASVYKDGAPTARLVVTTDITERKMAEETLKRRVTQLALLSDIGSKIVSELDLDQVLQRAVSLVQKSFGYHHVALFTLDPERGELVMRARAGEFARHFPPDHRLKLGQGMVGWVAQYGRRLLANDVRAEPHYVNLYPGVIPTMAELSVPIRVGPEIVGVFDVQSPRCDAFDENDVMVIETLADQIAAAIGNARLYEMARQELVERRRTEEALRESEVRYRSISDLAANLAYAFRLDADGSFALEWVTEAFTRVTGYTTEEVNAAGGWKVLIHPDDVPLIQRHVRRLLAGHVDVVECRIVTKSGETRWVRNCGRPVWDESQSRIVRVYGAAEDITRYKEVEQYLTRTEGLTAAGHMAAALAREIGDPLQALRDRFQTLLNSFPPHDKRRQHLEACSQEIAYLADIAGRMLSLTHLEEDVFLPVPVTQLVQRALALASRPLERARIQVTVDLPAHLPPVLVVGDKIVQVLFNVLLNTVEALPEGGHVHVTARAEKGFVALNLINDGPPIPEEHLARVFEPFFTTRPESAGLGLFIGSRLVEQHGGAIRAENLKGDRGVSFTITLPTARPPKKRRSTKRVV